jgi:hypothetical protein
MASASYHPLAVLLPASPPLEPPPPLPASPLASCVDPESSSPRGPLPPSDGPPAASSPEPPAPLVLPLEVDDPPLDEPPPEVDDVLPLIAPELPPAEASALTSPPELDVPALASFVSPPPPPPASAPDAHPAARPAPTAAQTAIHEIVRMTRLLGRAARARTVRITDARRFAVGSRQVNS